jgi:hypothetical protein
MKIKILYLILVFPILLGCKKETAPYELGEIDPSSFVAIGTNATAGYADDALYYDAQINSYPYIFHQQLTLNNPKTFTQPLLAETANGINLKGDAQLIMGYKTDCKDTVSLSPVRAAASGNISAWNDNTFAIAQNQNMGVPGLEILKLNQVGLGNSALGAGNYNPFYARMTSDPANASVLSDALALNPSFFTLMLGDADIMKYATSGGTLSPITPSYGTSGLAFEGSLDAAITALKNNGANGAIANIPDLLDYPYFTTIPYNGLTLDSANAASMNAVFNPIGLTFEEGDNPFTIECDCNPPYNVRKMVEGELILLTIPLDSVKCLGMGSINPIPDRHVLTLAEIDTIQTAISEYNAIISSLSAQYNLALADLNQLYKNLQSGILYNGININAEFVTGGAFSLDGRNMNPIGQALIANEFIKAVNQKFNAEIPHADVTKYRGVLFP